MKNISMERNTSMGKITIKEASREMQISEQFLRVLIREGKFPWATATRIKENGRWTYFVNEAAFRKYMDGEL